MRRALMGIAMGSTAAAIIYSPLGARSGAHMNPSVTLAFVRLGKVARSDALFALAAKEVFEATLPGGPLESPRRALSPLAAAVGGMLAPALIYVALASTRGPSELTRGWAIPCATDIAFSAMIARIIFPAPHPAIPFLLLLAFANDALGLMILAIFYPSAALSFPALAGFMTAALALAVWLRRRRTHSFWLYVIGPSSLSWAALYLGGFHPALARFPSSRSCRTAPATSACLIRARSMGLTR